MAHRIEPPGLQMQRNISSGTEFEVGRFAAGHGCGTFAVQQTYNENAGLTQNPTQQLMTLREFFDYLSEHPLAIIGYFLLIPIIALLAGWMGRGAGHQSPWKYLYAVLVYAVCIPGIFSIALSLYLFLFERGGSILNTNLLTQVVPVVSMILTLSLIRQNAAFESIPGFGKLSSLMLTIGAIFILMYLLDRTHLTAFVFVPVQYLVLMVVALILVLRYGFRQLLT